MITKTKGGVPPTVTLPNRLVYHYYSHKIGSEVCSTAPSTTNKVYSGHVPFGPYYLHSITGDKSPKLTNRAIAYSKFNYVKHRKTDHFPFIVGPIDHTSYSTFFNGCCTMANEHTVTVNGSVYSDFINSPVSAFANNHTIMDFTSATFSLSPSTLDSGFRQLFSTANLLGLPTFSIANFLYELKDIGSFRTMFSHGLNSWSDIILGTGFGILPTIDDIKSLFDIATNARSSIERWNKMAARSATMNIHRAINLPIEEATYEAASTGTSPMYLSFDIALKAKTKRKIVLSAYIKPSVVDPSLFDDIIRQLVGLDDPLSIVWEAMPYSFLIDWFINVGKMLENLNYEPPLVPFTILSCGYSYKGECTIESSKHHATFKDGFVANLDGVYHRETLYLRSPYNFSFDMMPPILDSDSFRLIKRPDQAMYLAALSHQRLR